MFLRSAFSFLILEYKWKETDRTIAVILGYKLTQQVFVSIIKAQSIIHIQDGLVYGCLKKGRTD